MTINNWQLTYPWRALPASPRKKTYTAHQIRVHLEFARVLRLLVHCLHWSCSQSVTIFMVPRQASYNLLVRLILPTTYSRPRNSASQFTSQRISPRVSTRKAMAYSILVSLGILITFPQLVVHQHFRSTDRQHNLWSCSRGSNRSLSSNSSPATSSRSRPFLLSQRPNRSLRKEKI